MKTRFCPSPTGLLHLGNLRTALFNALLAKKLKGVFLLRIEDTDQERSKPEYTDALQEDLKWLGLHWDEGVSVGGDKGPYHQAERQGLYDHYYDLLEEKGTAYPCFCTEEQLALERKIQRSQGKPPRYGGICRQLDEHTIQQKIEEGLKPALRFKVPTGEMVHFVDLVKGEQNFKTDDIGDFIIRRANGTPPFMFCNAVDDALMGVTHALRGEDHLTNTPRQLMMLKALDLKAPQYGHISLIIGSDGSPLSKRHGSRSISELRKMGFLPLAIINYLARLGHYYPNEKLMSLDELENEFTFNALSRSPARFDEAQMLHWQKVVVADMSQSDASKWLRENITAKIPADQIDLFISTIKPNVIFPEEANAWAEIFYVDTLVYSDENQQVLQQAGTDFFETALHAVEEHELDYSLIISALKTKTQKKGKALFQPLRVALTNRLAGSEMENILTLLGVEAVKKRLLAAKAIL